MSEDRSYQIRQLATDLAQARKRVAELETLLDTAKPAVRTAGESPPSPEYLEAAVNASPAIAFVWAADEHWSVLFVSDNIRKFGYEPDDFTSTRIDFDAIIHPDDFQRVKAEATGYRDDKTCDEFSQEYRIVTREGETRWLDDRTWIDRDEKRNVLRLLTILLDVTKRKKAERALRESETLFRTFAENTPGVIGFYDVYPDGHRQLVYASKGIEEILGEDAGKALGEDVDAFFKMLHPDDVAGLQQAADWAEANNDVLSREYRLRIAPNTYRWVRVAAWATKQDSGIVRWSGHLFDAHRSKQAEIALQESEEQYRLLVANVRAAISLVDGNGTFAFVNDRAANHLKMKADDLIGRTQWDVFPKEIADDQMDAIRRVIDSGVEETHETRVLVGGEWRWFNTNVQPYKDAEGRISAAMVIAHDITGRRRAEALLGESEERFREMTDLLPQIVYEMDADGYITYVNQQGLKASGYSREDVDAGVHAAEVFVPEDRESMQERFIKTMGGEEDVGAEYTALRKDGSTFPVRTYSAAIIKDGKPVGVRGVVIDVTQQKRAEEKLLQANREQYNQIKRIAGGVAHEIYNALFPATSCLEKLRSRLELKGPSNLERNRQLTDISTEAVRRAVALTELVKDYSRLETEKHSENVILKPLITDILANHAARINTLKAQTVLDIPERFNLRGLKTHLHSLFNNLLINALDAMENAEVRKISVMARTSQECRIVVFSDTGCGIAEEDIPHVFEAFFSTKPSAGTGLGLTMVRKIAELYGGDVQVDSPEGGGTEFNLIFSGEPESSSGER